MSILKNRGTNSLNPSSSPIGRVATWTGVLIGCLLLAACQSSNIKSSKNHFLRPTDPPVYHNPGVQVQQPEQYGQEEGNNKKIHETIYDFQADFAQSSEINKYFLPFTFHISPKRRMLWNIDHIGSWMFGRNQWNL